MDIKTRKVSDVTIVDLSGKLDINSSLSLKECLNQALMDKRKKILINLADVDFINSSGLGILVSGLKMIREEDGELRFCNLQKYVRELFEISQLTKVFAISSTEDEALESFT